MAEPLPPSSSWSLASRRLKRRAADPLAWAFFIAMVGALLSVGLLGYVFYRIRVDVSLLQLALEAHVKERQVQDERWRAEFDEVYRTLYNPPAPAPDTRKPSAVEVWQINRDKELRERIRVLEQWRQRSER